MFKSAVDRYRDAGYSDKTIRCSEAISNSTGIFSSLEISCRKLLSNTFGNCTFLRAQAAVLMKK